MEKENRKVDKKVIITVSILILTILIITGISYALWQVTKVQEDTNIISSGCFGVEMEGNNAINIASAYPMSIEDGMKTIPYTFTIKNTCKGEANYLVNLEAIEETTFDSASIRVAIEENNEIYNKYVEAEKYYKTSKEARTLISGTLEDNGTVTYNLRLWIDENAPVSERNKVFKSKIVVVTGQGEILKSLADNVELGDYISMTPTSTSYIIPVGITGYESSQEINPSELDLWRVIRKNDDGTIDVVSEYVSSNNIIFKGRTGYLNYVGVLNDVASSYTNIKYVQNTRHMGFNGQTKYITDTSKIDSETLWDTSTGDGNNINKPVHGNKYENLGGGDILYETDINLIESVIGNLLGKNLSGIDTSYYISSRGIDVLNNYVAFYGRIIRNDGSLYGMDLYRAFVTTNEGNYSLTYPVRPILTLKATNTIKNGDGKSIETAYTFE